MHTHVHTLSCVHTEHTLPTHNTDTHMPTHNTHIELLLQFCFYRDVDTTKVKIQLWDTAGQERYCFLFLLLLLIILCIT